MSLSARISRLQLPPDVTRFLRVLSEVDAPGCTRLLDDRAASSTFALEYWAPRMLAGALSDAEFSLLAVPVLIRAALPKPAALMLASRLGIPASAVDRLLEWGLWRSADDGPGYVVHPSVGSFVTEPADIRAPEPLLAALLAADIADELPPTAMAELAPLVLVVAAPAQLAAAAPVVIDAMQLAERIDDAMLFGPAVVDRLAEDTAKAAVLFALAEALALEEDRDVPALVHYAMAAALAPEDTELRGWCRLGAAELHLERGELEDAGVALAAAHRVFVTVQAWGPAGEAATSLGALGIVAKRWETARDWLQEAVALGGKGGDLDAVADAQDLLAEVERTQGRWAAAEALAAEAAKTRALAVEGVEDDEEPDAL